MLWVINVCLRHVNWHLPSTFAPINMIIAAVVVSGITYQIHTYSVSSKDILCGGILQAGFQYLVNISYVGLQMMIFHGA